MYGLPNNPDLKFFCGLQLMEVRFSGYQITFEFEQQTGIDVRGGLSLRCQRSRATEEGNIEISVADGVPKLLAEPSSRLLVYELLALLEQKVVEVNASADGTLVLLFERGATLTVLDSFPNFESYEIRHRESGFIV